MRSSSPELPITLIQQLKGKKFAYGSGSSGNYDLLTVLTAAGLTTKEVTMVTCAGQRAGGLHLRFGRRLGHLAAYVQQVVAQDGAKVLARGPQYGALTPTRSPPRRPWPTRRRRRRSRPSSTTLNKAYVWAEKYPDARGAAWATATGLPASITDVAATVDSTTRS